MIVHDPTVVERYAQALFNVSKKQQQNLALLEEAPELLKVFAVGSSLRSFLEGPQITTEAKVQLLEKVLKGKINPLGYQLITLLLSKGRIEYVSPVLDRFRILAERDQGIYEARVSTALPLGEAEQQKLHVALEKHTGNRLKINYLVDSSLIGGVKVSYGDVLIDDTVKGKLNKLRHNLESAAAGR